MCGLRCCRNEEPLPVVKQIKQEWLYGFSEHPASPLSTCRAEGVRVHGPVHVICFALNIFSPIALQNSGTGRNFIDGKVYPCYLQRRKLRPRQERGTAAKDHRASEEVEGLEYRFPDPGLSVCLTTLNSHTLFIKKYGLARLMTYTVKKPSTYESFAQTCLELDSQTRTIQLFYGRGTWVLFRCTWKCRGRMKIVKKNSLNPVLCRSRHLQALTPSSDCCLNFS